MGAEGGTPRQLTSGPYYHGGPLAWSADGRSLVISANRRDDWEYEGLDSELYRVSLSGGEPVALTDRRGPDEAPALSPDGRWIAWTGFDDRYQGYQRSRLYVMRADGSDRRELLPGLDRDVEGVAWSGDSGRVWFRYDDRFRAAVVQKPVINWASFVLHADGIGCFSRYWFPGPVWEVPEEYFARSPLSLVGNVTTPTMLITGEEDWRAPMSETEQYFAAGEWFARWGTEDCSYQLSVISHQWPSTAERSSGAN